MVDHAGGIWWHRKQQEREIDNLLHLGLSGVYSNLQVYGETIDPFLVYEVYVGKIFRQLFLLGKYYSVKLTNSYWIGNAELTDDNLRAIENNLTDVRNDIADTTRNLEYVVKQGKKIEVNQQTVEKYENHRVNLIIEANSVASKVIMEASPFDSAYEKERAKWAIGILETSRVIINTILIDINDTLRRGAAQKFAGSPDVLSPISREDLFMDKLEELVR
jgi:hypothetical protein